MNAKDHLLPEQTRTVFMHKPLSKQYIYDLKNTPKLKAITFYIPSPKSNYAIFFRKAFFLVNDTIFMKAILYTMAELRLSPLTKVVVLQTLTSEQKLAI